MKYIKSSSTQIASILFLFVLAAIPLVLFNMNGQVVFNPLGIYEEIKRFLSGLLTGDSFSYHQGDRTRPLLLDLVRYFYLSFLYLISAGLIVLVFSFLLGIFFWKNSEKSLNKFFGFLGMIPDFILITFLQLLVAFIYQNFGFRVAKVASASTNDPVVLLPIITLIIIPLIYIVRALNEKTQDVLQEDYIRTAISKGLNKRYIYLYHITTNVTPFLKADLHKILAIMISNLFIVEYLFNLRGITALLFQHQIKFGYEYNLVIFSFLALFLLYSLVFILLKTIIRLIEGILNYEK